MEYINSKIKKFYSLFLTWSFFFLFFFPFLVWGNKIHLDIPCVWYYRNDFSLFSLFILGKWRTNKKHLDVILQKWFFPFFFLFPFFRRKVFFYFLFFFYLFFLSGYFVHISCHSNTKIFKNVFFWRKKGKREKIDKKFKEHLCFLL